MLKACNILQCTKLLVCRQGRCRGLGRVANVEGHLMKNQQNAKVKW